MSGEITVSSSTMTAEEMGKTFNPEPPADAPETPPTGDTPPADGAAEPVEGSKAEVTIPSDDDQPGEPPRERHVSRAQQRVNQALREKALAQQALESERTEKARLAAELDKLKATPPTPPEPVTPPPAEAAPAQPPVDEDPIPQEDAFTDWQEFQDAKAAWNGRKAARDYLAGERAKEADAAQKLRLMQQRMETAKTYITRADEAKQELPDFDETVNREVPFNPIMSEIVLNSPVGPHLAYHFGKNPADAERIAKLGDPNAMLSEMYRLEGRITAMRELKAISPPAAAAPAAPPVPISSAPPPPPALPAGSVVTKPNIYTAKTFAEFEAAENARLSEQRQRG